MPVASKMSSVVENVTLETNRTKREVTREREATKLAALGTEVELAKLNLERTEIELKLKSIPLLERELELKRRSETVQRIKNNFDEQREQAHAQLNSMTPSQNKGEINE